MADLNTTYHPYIQEFDYVEIKQELLYDLFDDESEIKQNMTKFLTELQQNDALQKTTAYAVSVPYTGTTNSQRQTWIKDRIEAIYNRLDLIRNYVEGYKTQIVAAGGQLPTNPLQTIGNVLALIPITAPVGAAATLIARLTNKDASSQQYKTKKVQEATSAIAGFSQDVTQLLAIRQQLVAELTDLPNTDKDTVFKSPIPSSYWPYIIGAIVVIILLLWLRKRNKKRSKK